MSSPPAEEVIEQQKTAAPSILVRPAVRRPPTPPGSEPDQADPPATPEDADILHQITAGDSTRIAVDPKQFARLESESRLPEKRFAYDPAQSVLSHWMPEVEHERVCKCLRSLLEDEIRRLIAKPEVDARVKEALRGVEEVGSTSVRKLLRSGTWRQDPDISFRESLEDEMPVLVGEVAFSQTTKDVHCLCLDYINNSKGMIQCAIAVDLPYSEASTGSVSVYGIGATQVKGKTLNTATLLDRRDFIDVGGNDMAGEIELPASALLRLRRDQGGQEAERTMVRLNLAELSAAYRRAVASRGASKVSLKRRREDAEARDWYSPPTESEYVPSSPDTPDAKKHRGEEGTGESGPEDVQRRCLFGSMLTRKTSNQRSEQTEKQAQATDDAVLSRTRASLHAATGSKIERGLRPTYAS
ncbi:hypothetical protein Tdes44962_MAKER09451 [Teratosphaeria destructans]|uniref:Uncharacterized protein n=1 Tax=Teratosphaeria destructans TaxID=418781 RepID=A0A9W7SSV2_9PEZI|nr:hypothetical protein Tdes44962_MAKER09451 [Teratosphaeria destructans]